jgi:hypothetical protein
VSILNGGDVAVPTEIVYVPTVVTASKSTGCTKPYVLLHAPRLAPTVPV